MNFVCDWIENMFEKEKMLVTCTFFFSNNVFNNFLRIVKSQDCKVKGEFTSQGTYLSNTGNLAILVPGYGDCLAATWINLPFTLVIPIKSM